MAKERVDGTGMRPDGALHLTRRFVPRRRTRALGATGG
jgi:hypothetical protein